MLMFFCQPKSRMKVNVFLDHGMDVNTQDPSAALRWRSESCI